MFRGRPNSRIYPKSVREHGESIKKLLQKELTWSPGAPIRETGRRRSPVADLVHDGSGEAPGFYKGWGARPPALGFCWRLPRFRVALCPSWPALSPAGNQDCCPSQSRQPVRPHLRSRSVLRDPAATSRQASRIALEWLTRLQIHAILLASWNPSGFSLLFQWGLSACQTSLYCSLAFTDSPPLRWAKIRAS